MITADAIKAFAPDAWAGHIDAIVAGKDQIEAAGLGTSLVWSHFMAQIAHESGGLTFVRENTGWTGNRMKQLWPGRFPLGNLDPRIAAAKGDPVKLANLAYSNRTDLGNRGGNDGWDYRGGGLIQLTGRVMYAACGEAIGIDLEGTPEAIEDPAVSLKAALWYWGRHDLNRFARHNYGRTVGNGINRGNPFSALDPIGYKDRSQWFRRAWAVFGDGEPLPDESTLYLGAYGPKVQRIQAELRELGYQLGAEDGVFGPVMARAIAGFKLDQGRELEPAEAIGPLTLAALDTASHIDLSPERMGATVASLAAAGSTEVATGRRTKGTGQVLLYTGAAAGAGELGLLDQIRETVAGLPALQTTVAPVIASVQWGLKNALWVAVIVGGVWMWVKGRDVVLARLKAHQTGANLSR